MNVIKKNPEWIIALGSILLIYNQVLEPKQCWVGIAYSPYEACPNEILTFLSLAVIILGIVLLYRNRKK